MQLVQVMGVPGGGTTCTAGILAKNGFYSGPGVSFEPITIRRLFRAQWSKAESAFHPKQGVITSADRENARGAFAAYRDAAQVAGYGRAVMKVPGSPLCYPELVVEFDLTPVLVYRDPKAVAKRWEFLQGVPQKSGMMLKAAEKAIGRVLELHEEYGWPIWEFKRDPDISALEAIAGHPLPVPYYDPNVLKHQ